MPGRVSKPVELYTPANPTPVKRAKKAKTPVKAASKGKAGKKEKKEGPKKANPFMMFSNSVRADTKKKNPEATFGEMGKLIGEQWRKQTEKVKADWKKKAEAETARLAKEYKANGGKATKAKK